MYRFTFVIPLFMSACEFPQGGMYVEQKEFFEYQQPKRLPSDRETKFINNLESRGYKRILIEIPAMYKFAPGQSVYKITLDCPFRFSENNYDSILQLNEGIANELYANIISNETIFECATLQVKFSLKNDTKGFFVNWTKSKLEKNNGFSVVKTANGKFKREII